MRNLLSFLTLFLFNTSTIAQNPYSNNPWILGDSVMLNFNTSPPIILNSNTGCFGGTSSVHDSINDVLLYAVLNQTSSIFSNLSIFNQLKIPVKNSQSIKCSPTINATLLLPSIGSNSVTYFLFSIVNADSTNCGLYYSTISNLGGLDTGIVISKNIRVLSNFFFTNGLTAVRHGNGKDWWILIHDYAYGSVSGTNLFYTFLLDSNGVSPPILQNVGSNNSTNACSITFNSDGTQLILLNLANLIEKFNFDRCTGAISNPQNIMPPNINFTEGFMPSPAISQDDTKLYVGAYDFNNSYFLYQFDLTAANIAASKCQVYQFTNSSFSTCNMKLAQNGSIYWPIADFGTGQYNVTNTNLSEINSPNNICTNTNFQPFSFYLDGHKSGTLLPNNPDFRLGPLAGSPCAPFVGIEEIKKDKNCLQSETIGNTLYFNSSCDEKIRNVLVYDEIGKLVFETDNSYLELSKLKQGFNILHINTNRNSYAIKKIVR